jgi:hypothetical protein
LIPGAPISDFLDAQRCAQVASLPCLVIAPSLKQPAHINERNSLIPLLLMTFRADIREG